MSLTKSEVDIAKEYYGDYWIIAMQNTAAGKTKCERDFKKKYKYAKLDKFEFDVELSKKGEVLKYIVRYKVPDSDGSGDYSSYDITSDTFKNTPNYRKDLFWKEFWEDTGTVQDFEKNVRNTATSITGPIYTNDSYFGWYIYPDPRKIGFFGRFDPLKITKPKEDSPNKNSYKGNTYLASLYAAYISTYLCGISTYHFQSSSSGSRMISSLMSYHLYFHMERFLKNPSLMDQYVTKDITKIIENNRPKIPKYTTDKPKFSDSKANLEIWKRTRPSTIKNRLHNVHYAKNEAGNIVGINYYVISSYEPKDVKNDWKLFVAGKTNGFTNTGTLLLQETIQSFVYAILGAQARTRYPIIGDKVNSKQTQEVFNQIVKDTITQTDTTVAINNMRKAIADTKTRLDLAICPGVILMPSKLVILDFTIAGYNNILTVAHKNLVFGKNNQVNKQEIAKSTNAVDNTPTIPTVRTTPQVNQVTQPKLPEKKSETKLVTETTTTAVATRGPTAVAKYVPQHDKEIFYTGISMATIGVLVAMFIL